VRLLPALALAALAATPATGQVAPPAELSTIAQAAAQRGIRTCLQSIDALAKDLARRYSIGVYFFNQLDRPDAGLVSISMELTPGPSDGPVYVSASFVPMAGAGCQVMLESTIAWQAKCAQVGVAYPGYRPSGTLLRDIGISAATGSERLFLIETPTGCISIEKSVYF
jgi:hypothetical protein